MERLRNEPADDCWLVPSGSIQSDETISAAFAGILLKEAGAQASFFRARFGAAFNLFTVPI